ncbi:protein FAM186B [Ochotona curzoniae]|uniref:protein FAM186B n=1 Tax=Ochotona curzoniae TaxID=130825 RepID=UPI001B345C5C|nr:protein FAM186B [Ochotona curzoniae]
METDDPSQLVTPASVKAVISRIETAQLIRAQEGISTQLSDILGNVNSVISRFQEELGYSLKEKADQTSRQRFILLEKIASFSRGAKAKEKHLYEILRWLSDWGESLTYEIRHGESEEEERVQNQWIQVMEEVLPLSLVATKGSIETLISLCSTLVEEQRKKTQISRHSFWQGWWGKGPQKPIAHSEPLSPEQMLQDRHATFAKVSEVKSMLQELLDSTMFNKGEVKAIGYMSTTVENLHQALVLQQKENRSLETKYQSLKTEMTSELNSQRQHFQKSIQALESKRDALLRQHEVLGGKYHDLLLMKHALELQLKQLQMAGGQAEVEVLADFTSPLEKEIFPKQLTVAQQTHQAPQKQGWLLSPISPSPVTVAWDSSAMPSMRPPLPTMAMQSRVADLFNGEGRGSLEPPLIPSSELKFSKTWESPGLESPDHGDGDQKGHFQEKEELLVHSLAGQQPSSRSSSQARPESQVQRLENEPTWEEETGLQQPEWAVQEQVEMLRQRETKVATDGQPQRSVPQGKQPGSPRKEPGQQVQQAVGKIFTAPSGKRNKEKAEPPSAPPPSRAQSASVDRRPHLPRSPNTQLRAVSALRAVSTVDFAGKPWACRAPPTKPKKSASFPITGTPIRRAPRSSWQRSLGSAREKVFHMDLEAQRKNLQLLSEASEAGLPHHLRSKASELITTTLELGVLRLQCLCHKYILHRRLQGLRLKVMRVMRDQAGDFCGLLERLDRLQGLRLQAWGDRQRRLEEQRQECLSSMAAIFPKLQLEWNIHLSIPEATSRKPRKHRPPSACPRQQRTCSASTARRQPFASRQRECVPLHMACQPGKQMEAVWKMDVASSSHPIEKKTPVSLPWDPQRGGPDIPRMLAMRVHSCLHRSLTSLQARSFSASAAQKKQRQEPTDESAKSAGKKSREALAGTEKGNEDEDSASSQPPP